jgi:hypothetical protein
MRRELLLTAALAILAPAATTAAQPEMATVELHSGVLAPGLPLAESDKGVYEVRLTAKVDKKGEGKGVLVLEPNAPQFDDFGFVTTGGPLPLVTLECTLKFVKKETYQWRVGRVRQEEWLLFAIQGPKIISALFLATRAADRSSGRLAVQGKDGKVHYAVQVYAPPPPEPCHPGCFPAGTVVSVPGGTRPIERVREGDLLTTVGPDGTRSQGQVAAVFVTRNRLLEVRTEAGNLVTTETQPLALAAGGLRAAGELKAGDQICRWDGDARRMLVVQSVAPTGREERVFNLVLGDPTLFIANGFLVRSKPPAPVAPTRTPE